MTIKKNFNFIPNSSEGVKNKSFQPAGDNAAANCNYLDSSMKENKYTYSKANYQDQSMIKLPNYNTETKNFDYATSKFNGKYKLKIKYKYKHYKKKFNSHILKIKNFFFKFYRKYNYYFL